MAAITNTLNNGNNFFVIFSPHSKLSFAYEAKEKSYLSAIASFF